MHSRLELRRRRIEELVADKLIELLEGEEPNAALITAAMKFLDRQGGGSSDADTTEQIRQAKEDGGELPPVDMENIDAAATD